MKITQIQVHNFSSFNSSPPVELPDKLANILGKNESGKTSFLRALESFEGTDAYERDQLCSYSTATAELDDELVAPQNLPVITITFSVEPIDASKLKEIHEALSSVREISVTKFMSGRRQLRGDEYLKVIKQIEGEIISAAASLRGICDSLLSLLRQGGVASENLKTLEGLVALDVLKNTQDQVESTLAGVQATIKSFQLEGEGELKRKSLETDFDESKNKLLALLESKTSRPSRIFEALPKFIYYSNVDQLEDKVGLGELRANPSQYRTLGKLIELIGLDVEGLVSANLYERRRVTKNASAVVTGLVNESWKQEEVDS